MTGPLPEPVSMGCTHGPPEEPPESPQLGNHQLSSPSVVMSSAQYMKSGSSLKEYPRAATADDEPYYPVFDEQTIELAERYKREAEDEGVFFVGRLAEYEYYNMDAVVGRALQVFSGQIAAPVRTK